MKTAVLAVLFGCMARGATLTYSEAVNFDTGEVPVTEARVIQYGSLLPGFPNLPGQTLLSVTMSIGYVDPQLTYSITNPTQGSLPYCVDYFAGASSYGPGAALIEIDEGGIFGFPEVCGTLAAGETVTGEHLSAPGFMISYPRSMWNEQSTFEFAFGIYAYFGAIVSDHEIAGGGPTTKLTGSWRRSARFEAAVTYEFIPEPSTYALCGLGLGALALMRQRGWR